MAYDWDLLKKSVPPVYKYADIICLSIDKNRKSWGGKKYDFNDTAFYEWVKEIDTDHKVKIYEDDFCIANLSSIQNDNRQR